MMDDFREWLSDNLRYILLGLAVILVIVLAVFAVKLISGSGKDVKPKETERQSQAVVETEPQSETEAANPLVENDPAVLETVQKYYTAVKGKDIEGLKQIVETLDEADQQAIENNNVIESYENIASYSKKGPEEGSYVVYAYYEGKLADYSTLVPSLWGLYLKTREDGSLYVADWEDDETVSAYIEAQKSEADVKALIDRVNTASQQAVDSDPDLKAYMESLQVPETESVIPEGNESGVEVNKLVQAKETCNIRSDSREDAEILGMLAVGQTITRLRILDNGWSEVRMSDGVGYIRSDLLTEDVQQ